MGTGWSGWGVRRGQALGRDISELEASFSTMHRYQGGTSSILYNMSNLGSVDRDTGGSLVEVPAEPRDSCWGSI